MIKVQLNINRTMKQVVVENVNYLLKGFGFENWVDFVKSAFGFVSFKVSFFASIIAYLITNSELLFGVKFAFIMAYVGLILFEWISGVLASRSKGEPHKSRKLGRMLFKVFTYMLLMTILNQFTRTSSFPEVVGFELDPFIWLYWIILIIIIWQLVVSLLENFKQLGYKWADIALRVINKKFYEKLHLNEAKNETEKATKGTNSN